ncbi:hypothetical protein [Streptomyces gobiensis]|uniref:hypothetical protein n=1 Tax=Streptomyces gobiensis TaxID=2875706 RepID=UPI001E342C7F|nr:hypothetical protein [Streptomyces gobiensis]UGY91834.1 hypothetical protein test1122_08950 [Streptomyces gobiensis]
MYTLTSCDVRTGRYLELLMYGPATPPPPPPPYRPRVGTRGMAVRLLFAALPLVTLGLASWAPSLRFAIIRKRPLDWAVFALSVVLTIVYIVLLVVVPDDPEGKNMSSFWAGLYIMLLICGAVTHAILADRFPRTPAPHSAPHPAPAGYGYPAVGYPPPFPQSQPQPQPQPQAQPQSQPQPQPQSQPQPQPQSQPQPPPQSSRMRQVASELDELDALLRKREGQ